MRLQTETGAMKRVDESRVVCGEWRKGEAELINTLKWDRSLTHL